MASAGNTALTDSRIKAIKPPATGRIEVADGNVQGLRVRVSSKGTKTFVLRKRQGEKLHNITLGKYGPRFGLSEARRKARTLLNDLEAGKGAPKPKRRSQGTRGTFRAMIPDYLATKTELRSHREIERILNGYVLPEFGDRMADTVTRAEVTELIDGIAVTAPTMARAVHAQLSAFYTWAMPRLERLEANPCRDAGRPAKPKARDRVLSDDEMRALWQVADGEFLPWGPALKLLMLTGVRRDEVFSADWAEFDLVASEWTIPAHRAKNGVPHIVPLAPAALAVVEAIPVIEGSPKLFPTRTKAGQAERGPSGFSKAQARFREGVDKRLKREAGDHWTLHDIRRTVATGLQRLGVRFEVTEAVLNHVSGARGGVAGVYQRHDWKTEKRAALDAWATELDRIVRGTDDSNVIKLERA
jgi:integrase